MAHADATAAMLTARTPGVVALAGDDPFTMAEFAAAIARQSGKPVA